MNNIRLTASWSLFALATLHAIALVGGFYVVEHAPQTRPAAITQPSFFDTASTQPAGGYQYLPQPQITAPPVNRSALDEVKQQTPVSTTAEMKTGRYVRNNNTGEWVYCPNCPNAQPVPNYVQPSYPTVVRQPTPAPPLPSSTPFVNNQTPTIQPGTTAPSNTLPSPKQYELMLFVGNDPRSQQLLEWFNSDPTLLRVKNVSNYQVYTRDSPMYKARFATTVPPDKFPAYVFQWSDGAHIHAAGGNFIAPSPQLLFSDLQKGMANSKSIREQQQLTGVMRQAGYSWDNGINPNMQLPSLQYLSQFTQPDCNGPECRFPRKPDGGGGGSLDDLWNAKPQALAWVGQTEMIALVVIVGALVLAILKKHSAS